MVCIDQIYTAYTRCFDPDVPARTTCLVDVGGLRDIRQNRRDARRVNLIFCVLPY